MNLLTRGFICVVVIVCLNNNSRACMPEPPRYFDVQTYIDPDFKERGVSRIEQNRRKMFRRLLNHYVVLHKIAPQFTDSAARELSRREEPSLYKEYQEAANLFHEYKYENALSMFSRLRQAAKPDPAWWEKLLGISTYSWVHEAATYMVARCNLITSQDRYDGYSYQLEYVNQDILKRADSMYLQYLEEYPEGLYTRSAQNIRRKIYYLSDSQPSLNRALKNLMLESFPAGEVSLPDSMFRGPIDEFQQYFKGNIDFANDSPVLTAYAWLGSIEPEPDDLLRLEARGEGDFAAYPGLYRYVRALGLYRLERFRELLEVTPAEPPVKSTMWLSTELLRARAMIKLDDLHGGRTALEQMYQVSDEQALALELGIAIMNSGEGLDLFRSPGPIVDENLLRGFATYGLADSALTIGINDSAISSDRQELLKEELARRYVLSGRFNKLMTLLENAALSPYASTKRIFGVLAEKPDDIEALADFGEFLFENHAILRYSRSRISYGDVVERCLPCGGHTDRVKNHTTPLAIFLSVVKLSREAGLKSEAEAKALHYIVMSERRGRWRSQIAWSSAPPDRTSDFSGEQAFARLHSLYKDSPWAAATPYHY